MNRFMIGQYGAFDENKYRRDFRDGFYGIEACLFREETDWRRLAEQSDRRGFRVGVHFPLRDDHSGKRDALVLAADETLRREAYERIERELAFLEAAGIRPAYVLFHYPKPVILDERADWSGWRFSGPDEYVREGEYQRGLFKARSEELFEWLSAKGREHDFSPILEFDALNRYVYEDDIVEPLLRKHSDIRLCLDTRRLHMQERIDPHFDSVSVFRKFARYAGLIHLSNVQIDGGGRVVKDRCPVLPSQRPEDGWAPVEHYLRIVKQDCPDAKIMFEHQSSQVSDGQLQQCYEWVDGLLRGRG